MQKTPLPVIIILLIFLALGSSLFLLSSQSSKKEVIKEVIETQGETVVSNTHLTLDTVSTPAELERGLSGRTGLAPNAGMLFLMPTVGRHAFWMKDMLFPIDIIWLDADYRVVDIKAHATPESYPELFFPKAPAKFILEVNAGFAAEHELQEGSDMHGFLGVE